MTTKLFQEAEIEGKEVSPKFYTGKKVSQYMLNWVKNNGNKSLCHTIMILQAYGSSIWK